MTTGKEVKKESKRELKGDRPRVLDHPSHLFRCTLAASDDKITFVLAIFVVHHNKKFTVFESFKSFRYSVKGERCALRCINLH